MDLFEWNLLGSFAGAVFAVSLLTQITKEIPGVRSLPTQLWSYLLAVLTLLLAKVFGPGCSPADAALAIFNGALVSLAANGGYEAVERLKQGLTGEEV